MQQSIAAVVAAFVTKPYRENAFAIRPLLHHPSQMG